MKIVYIFPQCICNKYYVCDFRMSLRTICEPLSLASSFKRSKIVEVLFRQKVIKPAGKKKESHRKENTTTKKYEQNNNVHKDFKSPRGK